MTTKDPLLAGAPPSAGVFRDPLRDMTTVAYRGVRIMVPHKMVSHNGEMAVDWPHPLRGIRDLLGAVSFGSTSTLAELYPHDGRPPLTYEADTDKMVPESLAR